MDYATVRQRLSLATAHDDAWGKEFDHSDALAKSDDGSFWREARVRALAAMIGLSDDARQACVDALEHFQREAALRRLLWHCHHLLFVESTGPIDSPQRLPMLPPHLGPAADMFYGIVFLSGVETVRARHHEHEVSGDISIDTLRDIEIWMRDYRVKHGRWGLAERWWPSTYFSGALLKLGRLQFLMTHFSLPFVIYRRREGDDIIALAESGARFRADGQFFDADEMVDPNAWTAELRETDSLIRGQAASPRGAVDQRPVELPADQGTCILRRGHAVLDIHIPAIGPLNDDDVAVSLAHAEAFFHRHYPDFSFQAYTCFSWLLDPQLRDYLPQTSNIVRFMDRFHLLPMPAANHRQAYERVFGNPDIAIDQAPAGTALQRSVIAHVRAGGRWRMTAGVIPRSSLAGQTSI